MPTSCLNKNINPGYFLLYYPHWKRKQIFLFTPAGRYLSYNKINFLTASSSKYGGIVCFSIVTAVYFFSTWLTFKGFNGTDDLHYALLSSELLKGKYHPFEGNDIFSGRILLIAWQAFIYLVLGMTTFSTQVGTLLVTVGSGRPEAEA